MSMLQSPRPRSDRLADRIDAVLPQTQCRQCGFPGCRPYADAMASGEAPINRCPPGGESGIRKLAALLGVGYQPFDPDGPQPKPKAAAVIDEDTCIGCTLCIQACPVDAILGTARRMHTVLRDECTGCELCLAPCPVDCIRMEVLPVVADGDTGEREAADRARARFEFRNYRLRRDKEEKATRLAARAAAAASPGPDGAPGPEAGKQAAIQAALARVAANRPAALPPASAPASNIDKKAIIEAALARAAARKAAKTEGARPAPPDSGAS